ncbi:amidohydrolase [Collinsella sp. AGMB00827]|uniref:Amidohydrolase n=1 Tax=Collinsella ureilytica TaxID=2869515 RepID=A0ABS7MIA4_9ACTN|nr:amidohydrolase [Collinsella urealyticum]MBY4797101.1 amidohydrolase [Collinsella urealyticum]
MARAEDEQERSSTHVSTPDPVSQTIRELGHKAEPDIIELRRHFHRYPELSMEEFQTTEAIASALTDLGIPYTRPLKTGLVATLRGTAPDAYLPNGEPRRRILLRADIDALPVVERTGEPFASAYEGRMHACGHDCHIAMMLGCITILSQMTDALRGEVRIVFQPSEENGQGAQLMVDAGATDGVDGAFAMHIWSEVDAGTISCEAGPRMAHTDWFRIDIEGTSCHGAMPQRGADAVMAAASIVCALQTIVSRDLSPYDPAVVTVGEIAGGTARNVIAGSAHLSGTVRIYSDKTHDLMPGLIKRIAEHTAAALGAEAHLSDYTVANLKVENDPRASELCARAAAKIMGPAALAHYQGTMSGEDFSAFLAKVPGVLVFIGTRNPAIGATFAQHSCYYKIDESVLAPGAMLAAQYAIDFLASEK